MANPSSDSTPVIVDAMGGDYGPKPVVEGALQAAKQFGIASILVGNQDDLRSELALHPNYPENLVQIKHSSQSISMDDSATAVLRRKPDASIRVAFELVKQNLGCAVISPGNTGAVMAAGMLVSGTLPGIARPAIASFIPKVGALPPTVLLDSGANVDCNANQLVQFALMGNYYARSALGIERPRIALLSNGSEPTKGTDIIRSAAHAIGEIGELNFIGYIEGKDLARDATDVVVCDGFVGNVLLKTMEGSVVLVFDSIKHNVKGNLRAALGMWLCKPMFKALFREKLDASAYGGAPLLGLNDIAIICHGSANSRAILNAIKVARRLADQKLAASLCQALSGLDMASSGDFEDGLWNRMEQRFDRKGAKKAREQKEVISKKIEIK